MATSNALVDPYGIFASPIDCLETQRELESRVAKAHSLSSGSWETILFGSSRVHSGLDTDSPALAGARTFNAGFPATSAAELDLVVRYALEHNRPNRVVIFTGLEQFTGAFDPRNRTRDLALSGMTPEGEFCENRLELLFGTRSLRASWGIVSRLGSPGAENHPFTDRSGRLVNATPPKQPLDAIRARLDAESGIMARFSWSEERFEDLCRAARRCLDVGIETWVVVSPVHALHLELYRDLGLWQDYERMIRRLPLLSGEGVKVWTFGSYVGAAAEPIPLDPGAPPMRGYLETSHFTHAIGDAVLMKIFGGTPSGAIELEGTRLLDVNGAAAHILKLRADRANYLDVRARDVAWYREG